MLVNKEKTGESPQRRLSVMSVEKTVWGKCGQKSPMYPQLLTRCLPSPNLEFFVDFRFGNLKILSSPPSPTPSESQFVIETWQFLWNLDLATSNTSNPPPPELELLMENLALLWPSDLATSHHS